MWYLVGTAIVHIFRTKLLVLETVYSEKLRGDISFAKHLARWYVAVPMIQIIGWIGECSTSSLLQSLWILAVP